jgi:hypothetical protein
MQVVKEIAGEDGMTLCRSLLDGIEDDGDADLQGRIIEGRCTGEIAPCHVTTTTTVTLFFLFFIPYHRLLLSLFDKYC